LRELIVKRKKLSIVVVVLVLAAMTIAPWAFILLSGVTRADLNSARDLNARIDKELRAIETVPNQSGSGDAEGIATVGRTSDPNSGVPQENQQTEIQGDDTAVIEEMYKVFISDPVMSVQTVDPDLKTENGARLRNVMRVINGIAPPEQFQADWNQFLQHHGPNFERFHHLWIIINGLESLDSLRVPQAGGEEWRYFNFYLGHLARNRVRELKSAKDTRSLAKFLIEAWTRPVVSLSVRYYIDLEDLQFRRSDWEGLDWSSAIPNDYYPIYRREEVIREWDQAARSDQQQFYERFRPLKKRLAYHFDPKPWQRVKWGVRSLVDYGNYYEEKTRWRRRVFGELMAAVTYEDCLRISHELPVQVRRQSYVTLVEGKIVPDPAVFLRDEWYKYKELRVLDAALRVSRGEIIPTKPDVNTPFYFPFGIFRVIALNETNRYQMQLFNEKHAWADYMNLHKLEAFKGEIIAYLNFRTAEPLVQGVIEDADLAFVNPKGSSN
jgi:hypothetical protein